MHRSTSQIADHAIEWARARLGSPAYATRCLAFVEDAVERPNDLEVFGGDSAADSADLYRDHRRTGDPPRGAFVFYDAVGVIDGVEGSWGHVGLSLGDGRIIHAWDRVRIDRIHEVESLPPPPGWTAPAWWGWVPLDRVLAGAQPRAWPTDETAEAAAQRQQAESLSALRGSDDVGR
ncbi:C40 family peptidase [Microbacterium radiodurans]|uniref:NlpC/P60 family protein n=1 Tax=Microbacterium radiodurans TaxID=661398 RepID=A0A5J5IQA1_9MICO|nr:NlpC/P60 family protein [Microbacterium radiodurans]KAA9085507.1 NlpC/P60 family protein [Microbacterium radiodurans]